MQNTSLHDLDDEEGEIMVLLEAAMMILFPHDPPPLSADNVSVFVTLIRQQYKKTDKERAGHPIRDYSEEKTKTLMTAKMIGAISVL